jgi:hypothetical protein
VATCSHGMGGEFARAMMEGMTVGRVACGVGGVSGSCQALDSTLASAHMLVWLVGRPCWSCCPVTRAGCATQWAPVHTCQPHCHVPPSRRDLCSHRPLTDQFVLHLMAVPAK